MLPFNPVLTTSDTDDTNINDGLTGLTSVHILFGRQGGSYEYLTVILYWDKGSSSVNAAA